MSTARTTVLTGLAALTATAALAVTGCLPTLTTTPNAAGETAALDVLPVHPENTTAPYDRDAWGDWTSHGRGCDTREIVLTEQSTGTRPGADCRPVCPATGPACWHSPYDNVRLRDPSQVHIDHRVPLAEAHRSGGADWTEGERERFANDPANLVAASASSNTAKGDGDPTRWKPDNVAEWCGYATAYITTKHTYRLSVDRRERDALAAMLATCTEQGGGA
ncbi:HNH endonuclease family protein [Actinophytocola gossypii]|uniref:HNH endonuclease n=1 Tax=Actinophytocola gossypii TaxID=2812003 RepID=A0ABT2JKF5_9PSEU|nr:HNH endonuclease family protein [Actinophytocola gossypii]MCT2587784.1 HNH endonuclease [Actinophytocola gossypii]